MLCHRCQLRLRADLTGITELFAILPLFALLGSGEIGKRHGKGNAPPAPGRLDVMVLSDPRSDPTGWVDEDGTVHRQDGPSATLTVVGGWAQVVREERELAAPEGRATVAGECNLLLTHLDWICGQGWCDEFAADVKAAHKELRSVCGIAGRKPLGKCPAIVGDGDDMQTCGAPLYPPERGDAVQCRTCLAAWSGVELIRLGMIIEREAG